ncbi:FadR/GntR family transcriptional regulator [Vreelandella profundi]|uniref:FadR/GntR family transcriptional regulator n=2 Tax=Vreelandella profundi TaxID=2852117 RepID=UPI001F38BC5B
MTTKTKVEKTKVLYDDVCNWILRGQYLRGSRLPTEAELSLRYDLSRSSIRQVIARLKMEGLVTSRQGAGLFVIGRPTTALDAPNFVNNVSDLTALFDFRLLIETESAALAASKHSQGDIEHIEEKSRVLSNVFRNGGQGTQEDFDFHLQIAKTSGNKFLLSSVLALQTGVVFTAKWGQQTPDASKIMHSQQVKQEHADIVEAISSRDDAKARAAMGHHIEASRSRILYGQP